MIGADVDFNYRLSSLWSVENYIMFNPFKIKKINLVKKELFTILCSSLSTSWAPVRHSEELSVHNFKSVFHLTTDFGFKTEELCWSVGLKFSPSG